MRRILFLLALNALAVPSFSQNNPVPFLTANGKYQYVYPENMQPANGSTYDLALPFSNGLALTGRGKQHQYITPTGESGIKGSFDEAASFRNGHAVVHKNNTTQLIDAAGQSVPLFGQIQEWTLSEDRAVVTGDKGKSGYIDTRTGLQTVPMLYEFARPYSEGFAAVRINGKWGFIDKGGKITVPATYDDVTNYGEGLAGVRKDNKWGVINQNGTMVIPARYDRITKFVDGHAFVKLTDGTWGVIDNKGVPTSQPMRYQMITQLSDGLAAFMTNDTWGFMDIKGNVIIKPAYTMVASFEDGIAMVIKDGKRFYIDKQGREFRSN